MTKNKTKYETARDKARQDFVCEVESKELPEFKGFFACGASFVKGSDFGREYERAKSQKLVEALKPYINDIHHLVFERYGQDYQEQGAPAWLLNIELALKAYEEDV